MFTTARLRLRAHNPSDLDNILSLMYNDPTVAPHITHGFVVPRTRENFAKTWEKLQASTMFCVVEEVIGGAWVGFTAFLEMANPKDRDLTFAIAIAPEFWCRGYGTEITHFMISYAFRSLAAHRVSLTVTEGNKRAYKLYKQIGFVEEGRLRKKDWVEGAWRDIVLMGILDEEWDERKHKIHNT